MINTHDLPNSLTAVITYMQEHDGEITEFDGLIMFPRFGARIASLVMRNICVLDELGCFVFTEEANDLYMPEGGDARSDS